MKKAIATENAPQAIGPYSQAVEKNNTLFLSGQIPLDTKTGCVIEGGIAEQTHQVFKNIAAVLDAAGYTFDDVVKTTVYLTDLSNFNAMNDIYATYLSGDFPARSTVGVNALPKNVLVEIDVIAMK